MLSYPFSVGTFYQSKRFMTSLRFPLRLPSPRSPPKVGSPESRPPPPPLPPLHVGRPKKSGGSQEMPLTVPSTAALFLNSTTYGGNGGHHHGLKTRDDGVVCPDGDESSSENSSVGVNKDHSSSSLSDSTSMTGEDEVRSGLRLSSLESLESVDDALPFKRGLSNFFNGKSRSFQCLSEVVVAAPTATASDLAKKEHPFNKRKRILMSSKSSWRRRASCTSLFDTPSLSGLHSLEENRREEEAEEVDDWNGEKQQVLLQEHQSDDEVKKASLLGRHPLPLTGRRVKSYTSLRCFSLVDLQQHAMCDGG